MNRRRARPGRGDHGQATVEFALVLPLILVLTIGVVQVGRIAALQVATIGAARDGARAAAVDPRARVARDAATAAMPDAQIRVRMQRHGDAPELVTVRVTTSLPAVPLLGWSTVQLHGETTMAIEDS